MSFTDFTPVDARARGLATHLFTRGELEAHAGLDLPALARALAHASKLSAPVVEHASAAELERAVRLTSRHHLLTLSRWEGSAPALHVFAAEQDRRSVRAMLRGALSAAPAEERLGGLIPTPTLPERVLVELSRQPTPAAVVTVLFAVSHPLAEALLPLTAQKQPDLLALELALTRAWARWASQKARRGDERLRRFVAQRLDAVNAQTALVLETAKDVRRQDCFVEGGTIPAGAWLQERGLQDMLEDTPFEPLARELPIDPARFERGAFLLTLHEQRALARREPLSSAPVLCFLVRLEAQARDLRALIWAAVLGAPAALVKPQLVSP